MGGEKFATASCVLPFVSKMEKALASNILEPSYINKFKKDLWRDLKIRFDKNLNRGVLAKASFLDKRFFQLKFLGEEEKKDVISEILAEMKVLEEGARRDKEGNPEPPAKKSRFLGSGFSSSDEDEDGQEEKQSEQELASYQAEARLKSDGDPFGWWRSRFTAYPLLSR